MDAFSSSNQPSPPSHVDQLHANTNGSDTQPAKISGVAPVLSSMPWCQQNEYFWPCCWPVFTSSKHDNQAFSICPQDIKSMLIQSMLMPHFLLWTCFDLIQLIEEEGFFEICFVVWLIFLSFTLFCWACDDVNQTSLTDSILELLCCFLFLDCPAEIVEDVDERWIKAYEASSSFVEWFCVFC